MLLRYITGNICLTLPNTITNRVSTSEDSDQYIINFLQNMLPHNDMKTVEDELRKVTILINDF